MDNILEAKGITKQFPGVLANDHVNIDLRPGEIHALLGENGAGKTTLMNILYGLYRPDSGEILVKGKPVSLHSPKDAIEYGIGMVHQHFMLIPVFTVAENIMLGDETTKGLALDRKFVSNKVRSLSHQYGLDVNPDDYVRDIPVGVQQRVEIVKALYRNADILILDEPTAVLTPQEADDLFRIMRELTAKGVSIIFITHKDPAKPKEEVLKVNNLHVVDKRGLEVVRGISFTVKAGEVLGIAGVQGNGQSEFVEAISGLHRVQNGEVILEGHDVTGKSPRPLIELGMAHIPEDRQKHGLVLAYPVADNLILCTYPIGW
jgi:ABC-type uncharacterized transport system ATPase subunit